MRRAPGHRTGSTATLTPALLTLLTVACGGDAATTGTDFVVERTTTEDGTPLVRNVSGSKWGGDAMLVPEVTIGVLEGAEEYMLASPAAVWGTDEEIYVVDGMDAVVRVYDHQGTFLRRFGRGGGGPGEIDRPYAMLMTSTGRIAIAAGPGESGGAPKLVFFTPEGEFVEEWRVGNNPAFRIVETPEGIYRLSFIPPEDPTAVLFPTWGYERIAPDGPTEDLVQPDDPGVEPVTISVHMFGVTQPYPVPMTPRAAVSVIMPSGHYAHGYPDAYRFAIDALTGGRTVVERVAEPTTISPEEADHARRGVVASIRRQDPDFSWDGAEIPEHKPWYQSFMADYSERLWVTREGPAKRNEECVEPEDRQPGVRATPCFEPTFWFEVFNLEGEYLGRVDRPFGLTSVQPYIRDDMFVAADVDEDGAPVVIVYRIVLPPGADGSDT